MKPENKILKNNKNNKNNNLKVYTLSVPPSPQAPYLHPIRHSEVIRNFEEMGNTCFTMNWMGEVDFYILLCAGDTFDDYSDVYEQFELNIEQEGYLEIGLYYYDEEVNYSFKFCLSNPLEEHILTWLIQEKRVNVYYISQVAGEFICTGLKIAELPMALVYDLERFLTGKRALFLPTFAENALNDSKLTKQCLLQKAWGFYLDYTALLERIGDIDDTEEIVSRHLLDIMAHLQQPNLWQNKHDFLTMWVGRKIGVAVEYEPVEYYSIYLSGKSVTNHPQNPVKTIVEEVLRELPELKQVLWVPPLAEEAIPLVAIRDKLVHRFNLTNNFYYLSDRLFKEHYLPHRDYVSYYNRIVNYRRLTTQGAKVYSLVKKRREKGTVSEKDFTVGDIMSLVRWGSKEDLATIFTNIKLLQEQKLEEAIYILSQRYKALLEPHLFSLLKADSAELQGAVMLGLGLIESSKGIPFLIGRLQQGSEEAKQAFDALLIIGEPAIPYLIPLLKNQKANIRLRAVKILGAIGSEQALDNLNKMGIDRSIRVEKARKSFLEK